MSITVRLSPEHIQGEVTHSDDASVPLGTQVGLRLADFEGISEASATINGVIHPIVVGLQHQLADGSRTLTFELLDATVGGL